jgi:hypothetical protein
MQQKMEALRKANTEKVLGVLSPEQQGLWHEMLGEPFKIETLMPPRGGPRGGPGGPGGPRGRGNRGF